MFAVFVLAVGLAMDALAVALVYGALGPRGVLRAIGLGLVFGLAQGIMPLLGWGLGEAFAGSIEAYDHWVAFGLLTLLGGRMLFAAAFGEDEVEARPRRGSFALGTAAIATSIDAAAAGLALPTLAAPPLVSCLVIGSVTAVLCAAAYLIGSRAPARSGKYAEIAGGLILIALGTKILTEHLGA